MHILRCKLEDLRSIRRISYRVHYSGITRFMKLKYIAFWIICFVKIFTVHHRECV